MLLPSQKLDKAPNLLLSIEVGVLAGVVAKVARHGETHTLAFNIGGRRFHVLGPKRDVMNMLAFRRQIFGPSALGSDRLCSAPVPPLPYSPLR